VFDPTAKVSCTGSEPSLLQTQISNLPERFDLNTIFLPSGEYSGSSSSLVEKMSLPGWCAFLPAIGVPARQISLPPPTHRMNAS